MPSAAAVRDDPRGHLRSALSDAQRACLNAAQNIPIDSVRKSAESVCKKIAG